jgi:hypothetical protein
MNKKTRLVFAIYSIIDISKFIICMSDKIGIIDMIKKNRLCCVDPVVLEIVGIEHSDVGNFEIINN